MDAKQFLRQYGNTLEELELLRGQLETLDDLSQRVSSPANDGMPHGSGISDRTARYAVRITAIMEEIDRLEEDAARFREEIEQAINLLPIKTVVQIRQREILRMRYLDFLRWSEITRSLYGIREDFEEKAESYLRSTTRDHGKALQSLQTVIETMEG